MSVKIEPGNLQVILKPAEVYKLMTSYDADWKHQMQRVGKKYLVSKQNFTVKRMVMSVFSPEVSFAQTPRNDLDPSWL